MGLSNLFTVIGDTIIVASINKDSTFDTLPKGAYTLSNTIDKGFYLTVKESFFRNEKLYGDINNKVDKVIKSFNTQNTSLGVMLTGYKGSGKTMFTRELAKHINLPVIIIDKDYSDYSGFEDFINKLGVCVIIFDEFGKTYHIQSQEKMLSFFDGTSNTKKLIIITENNVSDISYCLKSRPSRFKYHFKFASLDNNIIKEFCADNNAIKIYEELIPYISHSEISFDILNTIIKEYHLFNKPVKELIQDLNILFKKEMKIEPIKMFCRNISTNVFKRIVVFSSTDSYYDNTINIGINSSNSSSLKPSDKDNIDLLLHAQGHRNTYNDFNEPVKGLIQAEFDNNDIMIVKDYAIITASNGIVLITKITEIPTDAIILDNSYLPVVEELLK